RSLLCIVTEPHLRALAVCRCMVQGEWQIAQSLCERICARSVAASRTALKEGCGLLKRQHIKRNLIGQFAPIREPRRNQHTRPTGWQKFDYVLWLGDIVVNQEPCRPLSRQSAQRSIRCLLKINFFCRCCTQRHGKTRKGTQEARVRFSRTPTNARIQTSEAVRILNGQRRFTDAAHALHRSAAYRMRHGSGLLVYQDGVKPIKLVSATCEACDTRRHPDE